MDMERFEPGQSAELVAQITRELTINRTGREGADVLSTPSLLSLMENACIKASDPYLPADSTTVGFAVDGLRHFAPTAVGEQVRVRSELTEVDRNRLTYSIEAFEGEKKIGVATHRRAVISTEPDV